MFVINMSNIHETSSYKFGLAMLWQVKLIGGYYDAGDNIKFGWPMSFSVSLLSWAAVEYRREISSVNQLSYLLQAIRWGANFIVRAHASSTTLYTQVLIQNSTHS